jgi:hypothetical protein
MATPKPAEAEEKPKVLGAPRFQRRSFTPKKLSFAAPTQGLEHIIFDNTGTIKMASTFNLNIEAISELIANRLKFDGPLAALAVRELKAPTINFPNKPTDPTNLIETTKCQRNFNHAHDQQKWWDENTQKIYNLVMQHSTPKMKPKLLTMDSWAKTSAAQDGIVLLKTIRDICYKKDGGANATTIIDLVRMDKDMFPVHKAPTEPLSSYLSKFKGAVNVVESLDWSPWSHRAATKIVYDKIYSSSNYKTDKNSNLTNYQAAAAEAQRQYLAVLFFYGLSNKGHRDLKKKIHNDALTESNTVPCTYGKVLQLADQYKSSYQQRQPGGGKQGGSIAFAQKGKAAAAAAAEKAVALAKDGSIGRKPHPVPGEKDTAGKMIPNSSGKKNCFSCSMDNHWVVNYPDLSQAQREELAGMAHILIGSKESKGIGFLQNKSSNPRVVATCKTLDPQQLYLDSTSSFHQVFTEEHLDNLRLVGTTLRAYCNAGTNFATKKGWYRNLFDLWLVRNGIANLLSLPQLEADGFTVSYHTGGNWIVTIPHGDEITFHHEEDGMCCGFPYIDMQSKVAVAMIQTVRQRYEGFTKREVQDAITARKAQAMTGHPADAQFLELVSNKTIKNCPIKPKHITNACSIFGPSIAGVRRKTVRCKPEQVEAEPGRIPDDFHCLLRFVVITADVIFVNGIAFLTTLSQKLQLSTVKQLPLRTVTQLSNSLTKIVRLYARAGFIVCVIMMDQEFNKVEDACNMVEINTTAAREHVGKIKCFIRTIKECSRALMSDLPCMPLPCQVVIHLVYFAVIWLNSLPATARVSDKYSPQEIVLGRKLNFEKHCKTTFGSYVEAHDDLTITNTMHPQTFPGIFLGPTGNSQGTHKVFDINTGVVKKPCTITPLPMPDRAIAVIEDWGQRHQKEDKASTLEFLNQK